MRPRVGASSPAACRRSVDLPAPLRPISATRSPGRRLRSTPRRIAGPSRSSCHTPRMRSATGARRARRALPVMRARVAAPALRARSAEAGCGCPASGSRPCSRSVARAWRTPAGGGRTPASASSRAAGVCSGGATRAAHSKNPCGSAVVADRAAVHRDHPVGGVAGTAPGDARRARSWSPTPG